MLEIQNLSFTVSDGTHSGDILNGVTLTIPDKRFVVITGPNGGGKTTVGSIRWKEAEEKILEGFLR